MWFLLDDECTVSGKAAIAISGQGAATFSAEWEHVGNNAGHCVQVNTITLGKILFDNGHLGIVSGGVNAEDMAEKVCHVVIVNLISHLR